MSQARQKSAAALAWSRNRIIVAITIGIAALLLALTAWNWSNERSGQGRLIKAQATQAARVVSAYGTLLQLQAKAFAERNAVATGEVVFPGLESPQFVPLAKLGIADPSFDAGVLRNNIETRLVGRTFNGETPRAEAYRDGDRWIIIAAARHDAYATDTHGVLLLRADLGKVMREQLDLPVDTGIFSLWARGAEDYYRFIAQPGTSNTLDTVPRHLVETDVRPLYTGFEPASTIPAGLLAANITVLLAGVAILLALAALVLLSFRRLGHAIASDARQLGELVLHQRSTTASLPPLRIVELTSLGEALLEAMTREPPATAAKAAAAATPTGGGGLTLGLLETTGDDEAPADTVSVPQAAPPVEIPPGLFRDYDIRGTASLLEPSLVMAIGQAIGSEVLDRGCTSIMVGMDGRESSPSLQQQLVKGLLATGINVVDLGLVATPMLYFSCHHLHTPSGVMVTGSHNPADHNGFKIMINGETLRGDAIMALRERIIDRRYRQGQGSYRTTSIENDYIRAINDDVLVDGGLRIVVDCGNGAAAVIAENLFRELGCEVIPLHCTIDGRFPNHHPDPAEPENLRELVGAVQQHQAALGIAFDGDGDRIGVVSAKGAIVTADRLLMLFAREILSRHPGADVVFDVKCSRDLPAIIAQHDGRPVMYRSGHSWIKEKMKETGALLGGEFTGHICFRDRWYGFDDALYCGARLLEILATEERSLDELLAELPGSIATPELRIPVAEERKFAVMDRIAAGIAFEGARIIQIDGIRAEFADGWGLVRASNTSPALILRFEATDAEALERIRQAFRTELTRLLPDMSLDF